MYIAYQILRNAFIGIISLWVMISVNPQVYFSVFLNPHKIVLYMDIVDMDEDVFYYFKASQGSEEYHQYQEEVKRDEVKKGKSFLKMKASVNIINFIGQHWCAPSGDPENLNSDEQQLPELETYKRIFHPPKFLF